MKEMIIGLFISFIIISTAWAIIEDNTVDFIEIFEKHGSTMLIIDSDTGDIKYANEAASEFYGYSKKELMKMNIGQINLATKVEIKNEMKLAEKQKRNYFLFSHRLKDGEVKDVEVYSYPVSWGKNKDKMLYSIIHDISEKKKMENEIINRNRILIFLVLLQLLGITLLVFSVNKNIKTKKILKESEKRYRSLFENMKEGFAIHKIILDENSKPIDFEFVEVNDAFQNITGMNSDDIVGKRASELSLDILMCSVKEYGEVALRGGVKRFENFCEEMKKYFQVTAFSPEYGKFATIFIDITDSKQKSEEIEYLSYHDPMTDLYNRRFFEDEIKRVDKEENLPIAIIVADVDGLKLANDAFGHSFGDLVIKEAAKTLKEVFRQDDIIARVGGDEFIILLKRTGEKEAHLLGERIKKAEKNKEIGPLNLSISIGIQVKRDMSEDIIEVEKTAEDIMYKEKFVNGQKLREKTVDRIKDYLYEKNNLEKEHSERCAEIALKIGEKVELNDLEMDELKNSALYHDIGKVAIDESILNKREKLEESELELLKRHCEIGYRILGSIKDFENVAKIVLAHHERWDGSGYPKGLKGEEIPVASRIIAIAEAYDAMRQKKSYKEALSKEEIILEFEKNKGIQFDPNIADVFIKEVVKDLA